VRAQRGALLSAALTILRAFVVAGKPTATLRDWGSYEGWSAVVRAAVCFAGLPDPYSGAAKSTDATDEEDIAFAALLKGLAALEGQRKGADKGKGFTVAEIADPQLLWRYHDPAVQAIPGIIERLLPALHRDQRPNKALGMRLHHRVGQVRDGLRLVRVGENRDGILWTAQEVPTRPRRTTEPPPDGAEAGQDGEERPWYDPVFGYE
jgi:hypothetical protein